MAAKSYKQMYEELKAQKDPITEEELSALRAVVSGCNANNKLRGQSHNGVRYEDAIITVCGLIERLAR